MTTESVLSKLAKLKSHADSARGLGNAEEASAFAAKVSELLAKHELTMSDVEYARVEEDDLFGKEFSSGAGAGQRRGWQEFLARVIARSFFCKILVYPGSDMLSFVGRESHRKSAEYVYSRLRRELEETANKEYKRFRSRLRRNNEPLEESHGFKASFREGYTSTIDQRLREQRREQKQEAKETGSGKALVRLDNVMKKTAKYMASLNTSNAGSVRGRRSRFNSRGRRRGQEHGRRANLSANGVGGGTSRGKIES